MQNYQLHQEKIKYFIVFKGTIFLLTISMCDRWRTTTHLQIPRCQTQVWFKSIYRPCCLSGHIQRTAAILLGPMLCVFSHWANHSPSLYHPCCVSHPIQPTAVIFCHPCCVSGPIQPTIALLSSSDAMWLTPFSQPQPPFCHPWCTWSHWAKHNPSLYHPCCVSCPLQPTAATLSVTSAVCETPIQSTIPFLSFTHVVCAAQLRQPYPFSLSSMLYVRPVQAAVPFPHPYCMCGLIQPTASNFYVIHIVSTSIQPITILSFTLLHPFFLMLEV